MEMDDPRILRKIELIIYHIQTNEGIQLSDKSRWDIIATVFDVVDYYKKDVERFQKLNHALRWNELRLWLKRTRPDGFEKILEIMELLDNKKSIRSLR